LRKVNELNGKIPNTWIFQHQNQAK